MAAAVVGYFLLPGLLLILICIKITWCNDTSGHHRHRHDHALRHRRTHGTLLCPEDRFVLERPDNPDVCHDLLNMADFPFGYSTNRRWCQLVVYERYMASFGKMYSSMGGGNSVLDDSSELGECYASRAQFLTEDNWNMCDILLPSPSPSPTDGLACFETRDRTGQRRIQWTVPVHKTTRNATFLFSKIQVYCIKRTVLHSQELNMNVIEEYAKNKSLVCNALYQWPELVKQADSRITIVCNSCTKNRIHTLLISTIFVNLVYSLHIFVSKL